MRRLLLVLLLGCVWLPAKADITIGVVLSTTGPAASIGILQKGVYTKGLVPPTIAGQKVRYVIYDDATDPTEAVKAMRRLVTEDHADIIFGPTITPAALAMAQVAAELEVPQIALAPIVAGPAHTNPWFFDSDMPLDYLMETIALHMKAHGVKTVAFIGFNDPWGDAMYSGFARPAKAAGIKIVTDQRYMRADTSVVGQVLKIMALHPDAVLVGATSTPAALPQITLIDHGYKGTIYHGPGVVNKDFIRICGAKLEGAIAATGPWMVAEELPDSNPIKAVALKFISTYERVYGPGTRNSFTTGAYDAFLLTANAVPAALKKAKPGTPEFRQALRDALEHTKDVVGLNSVYSLGPGQHEGTDMRARVLVRVHKGEWTGVKNVPQN